MWMLWMIVATRRWCGVCYISITASSFMFIRKQSDLSHLRIGSQFRIRPQKMRNKSDSIRGFRWEGWKKSSSLGAALSLVAYGSGKRMVTGTRAGSRIQTRNFKRRFLPHHKSQRRDIWCTNSPVVSCFNPKFVDRSVPYEAKQRRVKFRRCFGNIPLAECNVSLPNVRSSGTEPKAPVTDYRNRGSGNHTRG